MWKHYKNKQLYKILEDPILMQIQGEWVEAVYYENEQGMKFARERTDFFNKFEKV